MKVKMTVTTKNGHVITADNGEGTVKEVKEVIEKFEAMFKEGGNKGFITIGDIDKTNTVSIIPLSSVEVIDFELEKAGLEKFYVDQGKKIK